MNGKLKVCAFVNDRYKRDDLEEKGILKQLSLINHFTKLTTLNLGNNCISSIECITRISFCNLSEVFLCKKSIILGKNEITSIKSLSRTYLKNLQVLNLSNVSNLMKEIISWKMPNFSRK